LLPAICFALSPTTEAVTPAPDGGYPGRNTAEGDDALFSLTTGIDNTALGYRALYNNNANGNTAIGSGALGANNTGYDDTAVGVIALQSNTAGYNNTATGFYALLGNTTGINITENGTAALQHSMTHSPNT